MSPHNVTIREDVSYLVSCNGCGGYWTYTDMSLAEYRQVTHTCPPVAREPQSEGGRLMNDRTVAFQVRDEDGNIRDVYERSPLWHKLRHAKPGEHTTVAGSTYERLP